MPIRHHWGSAADLKDHMEMAMDVEIVSSLAPAAPILLYEYGHALGQNITDIWGGMNAIDSEDAAAVASISYGLCEGQGFFEAFNTWEANGMNQAAERSSAENISFFTDTCDYSNEDNHCASVNMPAGSPSVVAVGGTEPAMSEFSYNPAPTTAYRKGEQMAWRGTMRGASVHFQDGFQNISGCGGPWRCVPDISFASDPFHPAYIVVDGQAENDSETSLATPIAAALQVEIDQRHGTRKGSVTSRLYQLFSRYGYAPIYPGYPTLYADVTLGRTGSTGWTVTPESGWPATPGYDWASGIGTVDGWALSDVE